MTSPLGMSSSTSPCSVLHKTEAAERRLPTLSVSGATGCDADDADDADADDALLRSWW